MMRPVACHTCTFWVHYEPNGSAGDCHRRAPVVFDRTWQSPEYGTVVETATAWPPTGKDEWCGDHAYDREGAGK